MKRLTMPTKRILLAKDDENDTLFAEQAMHKKGMATACRNAPAGQEAVYTSFQLHPRLSRRNFVRRHGV